jgi:hypothetical protein
MSGLAAKTCAVDQIHPAMPARRRTLKTRKNRADLLISFLFIERS